MPHLSRKTSTLLKPVHQNLPVILRKNGLGPREQIRRFRRKDESGKRQRGDAETKQGASHERFLNLSCIANHLIPAEFVRKRIPI
jgi:hypothetical protein